jgi:hypothetical protein
MSKFQVVLPKIYVVLEFIIFGYIPLIFFSYLSFVGGGMVGLGELGVGHIVILMIIVPVPFILTLIMSIYYNKKHTNTKNIFIRFLQFSVLIFIITGFSGYVYKSVEWNNIVNHLENAESIIEEYRTNNNIEIISRDDFKNIDLPENITVNVNDDSYSLSYRYGVYFNRNGEGWIRIAQE